jgi:hypothetical protein
MLYGLTPHTAQRVLQVLDDGGSLPSPRGHLARPERGVTWVKVTGAMDADGWHAAVVSLDQAGEWEDLEQLVYVKSHDRSGLTIGNRYLCTRTGDDVDGFACFRTSSPASVSPNYIINGGFSVDQRAWVGVASGNYAWDRWHVQHNFGQAANCTYTGLGKYGGSGGYGWIQKLTGSNGGFLVAQVVENIETGKIRAGNLTMGVSALSNTGNGTTLTLGAFAWTGSPNSTASKNLVASWDGNTPVFNTANLTLLASVTTPLSNTTWANLSIDFKANTTTTTNIVMAMWSDNVHQGGAFKLLYLTDGFLVPTGSKVAWDDWTDAVRRCSRYYYAARYRSLHAVYKSTVGDNLAIDSYGVGNLIVSEAIPVPSMMKDPILRHSIVDITSTSSPAKVHNLNRTNYVGTASTVPAGNLTINAVRLGYPVQTNNLGDSRIHTAYSLVLSAGNGSWLGCGSNSNNPVSGDALMIRFTGSGSNSGTYNDIAFDSEI